MDLNSRIRHSLLRVTDIEYVLVFTLSSHSVDAKEAVFWYQKVSVLDWIIFEKVPLDHVQSLVDEHFDLIKCDCVLWFYLQAFKLFLENLLLNLLVLLLDILISSISILFILFLVLDNEQKIFALENKIVCAL